jgi:hypothetical protein
MTAELKNKWVKDILTDEELKQYSEFEGGLKRRGDKEDFEKQWAELVMQIKDNIELDPASTKAIEIGGNVMKLINGVYGVENANLKRAIWEKGFKAGKADNHAMNPEMVAWLDKAIFHYWSKRVYDLLAQVSTNQPKDLADQWHSLMREMYGDGQDNLKREVVNVVLEDNKASDQAKEWLKKIAL